jgi:hypothetical protein
MEYYDYLFDFPATGLSDALQALAALRQAGILDSQLPQNMLGDPRDANGNVVDRSNPDAMFVGRPGTAATNYTDLNGDTVNVPAVGDPTRFYIAIRSTVAPDQIPFNPATYGLTVTDPATSAAVLGVWA